MTGKTIQIYLPDGNPRGVKIAEITSSIGKAVFIPRSQINNSSERPELQGVGVYFLFGENDELGRPKTYIGEAEVLVTRIKQHNASKDFWTVAIAFLSEKNLNKAHVKFLENYCCNKAKELNKCELENSVNPTRSALTEAEESFVLHLYEDLKILLSTLGYPIFEEIKKEKGGHFYYCKGSTADAEGEYTDEGFVVFQGSKINPDEKIAPSVKQKVMPVREKLLQEKILQKEGNTFVFTKNYLFSSPSAAATLIQGVSCNGWTAWKTKEGKTLDEIERGGKDD